ncbi:ATP-binding protein [uncultured Sphaerochaeta sp.]|uniref:ATP-binding protein n=1 Tax=uncultured Sphaerochaeta sp. TaxID=886478 RepID=UPI002A0A79C6|nr:ATP-binding protein [uncultured Sphaerochaeta sp.]
MAIPRKQYLQKLIDKQDNGRVKIITGIRRCGKSYLLFNIYTKYLRESGVQNEQIIGIALDELPNAMYRNPIELDKYIREQVKDTSRRYYILIDEIQFVSEIQNPYVEDATSKLTFIDVVLGLMKIKNADVYVTGSNSRMLSTDILTQFRDRGDEIRVYPLSFAEFYEGYEGDKRDAWLDYYTYGGMPVVLSLSSHEEKSRYLRDLFTRTYLKDVIERHAIQNDSEVLEDLLNILASTIGSLTNPTKLSNTFNSEKHIKINSTTIDKYLRYFIEGFIISKAERYDVKGKKYIQTPHKYYFTDVGVRNARLGFRKQEETHIMENILYCDLLRRGFDVDVGVVEQNIKTKDGKKLRKQLEVDFIINRGSKRYYIQSALTIAEPRKREQEIASLIRIPDSFSKIVVVRDYIKHWRDDHGILYVGIEQFLLDENMIDL